MKKLALCILCLLCLAGCLLDTPSSGTAYPSEDGLKAYEGVINGETASFAGEYFWHGDFNKTTITIEDGTVSSIGGNTKSGKQHPFSVIMVLPETEVGIASSYPQGKDYKETIRVENVTFIVNLPASVGLVEGMESKYYYPMMEGEGNLLFLRPVYYLDVAKDHPVFTAKNGRLYRKDNGELVSGIAYWDE